MFYFSSELGFSALNGNEILTHITTWMNLEDIMLSEISQLQRAKTVWFHLYEVRRVVKFTETKRIVVAKDWREGGMGIYCLMDMEFVWEDEKVWRMSSGDGCTTMWMYLMNWTIHLKLVKMVNFMLYIFYHNKKYF